MRYLSLLSILACAAWLACGQEPAPTASGPAGKASADCTLAEIFSGKEGCQADPSLDEVPAGYVPPVAPADTTTTAPADTLEAAVVDTVAAVTGGGGVDAPSTSISLSARPHTVSEDAAITEITLTATLDGRALDVDAVVTLSVDPSSEAVRDEDYSALFNPLLTIAAGSTSGSAALLIDPTADRENEGNETITLTASTPGLSGGSVQITLSEDPTEPVVSRTPEEARAELVRRGIGYTERAFVAAARRGDLSVVKLFVQAGMDIEVTNNDRWTALHAAAESEHLEVVEFLVGAGADVNARDGRGRTPRRGARCGGAVADYLRSVGGEGGCYPRSGGGGGGGDDGDDDDDDSGGGGGGGGGCSVGQVVRPNQSCTTSGGTFRNVGGECFVYTPVGSGRVCGGGGSFNGLGVSRSGDNFMITAVPEPVVSRTPEEARAELETIGEVFTARAFVDAAEDGKLAVVKLFVAAGMDIDATPYSVTALYLAAGRGHLEIVKFLVGAGADLNATNSWGGTALHLAADEGELEVVKFLVGAGADVNATTSWGFTALHFAAWGGYDLAVVKYLVGAGADVNARDEYGRTPRNVAGLNSDVEEYLESVGG